MIFVIAEILVIFCVVTSVLDLLSNGSRDARWAPFGFGIAAFFGLVMAFT